MKALSFSFVLSVMVLGMTLLTSCHHDQVQQFNVDLLQGDGTKESYAMYAGSMLLVNDGDMHVVAKVTNGSKDELELQVTRYTVTRDTSKREYMIQKAGSSSNKIAMKKITLLDPNGRVQVNLQSVAMIDTGRHPVGACQGNCCEAKCFSTFCCSDPDECKNAPCDCKPPANCPGQPSGGQQASHFFELFLSGKDMMAFKE